MFHCHAGHRFEQFCLFHICLAPKQLERTKTLCIHHVKKIAAPFVMFCHGSTNARRPTHLGPIQKRAEFLLVFFLSLQCSFAVVWSRCFAICCHCYKHVFPFEWAPFLKCSILTVASVVIIVIIFVDESSVSRPSGSRLMVPFQVCWAECQTRIKLNLFICSLSTVSLKRLCSHPSLWFRLSAKLNSSKSPKYWLRISSRRPLIFRDEAQRQALNKRSDCLWQRVVFVPAPYRWKCDNSYVAHNRLLMLVSQQFWFIFVFMNCAKMGHWGLMFANPKLLSGCQLLILFVNASLMLYFQ